MKANVIAIALALAYTLAAIWLAIDAPPDGRHYPCAISEISPDIPAEVRAVCRRRRL